MPSLKRKSNDFIFWLTEVDWQSHHWLYVIGRSLVINDVIYPAMSKVFDKTMNQHGFNPLIIFAKCSTKDAW